MGGSLGKGKASQSSELAAKLMPGLFDQGQGKQARQIGNQLQGLISGVDPQTGEAAGGFGDSLSVADKGLVNTALDEFGGKRAVRGLGPLTQTDVMSTATPILAGIQDSRIKNLTELAGLAMKTPVAGQKSRGSSKQTGLGLGSGTG